MSKNTSKSKLSIPNSNKSKTKVESALKFRKGSNITLPKKKRK